MLALTPVNVCHIPGEFSHALFIDNNNLVFAAGKKLLFFAMKTKTISHTIELETAIHCMQLSNQKLLTVVLTNNKILYINIIEKKIDSFSNLRLNIQVHQCISTKDRKRTFLATNEGLLYLKKDTMQVLARNNCLNITLSPDEKFLYATIQSDIETTMNQSMIFSLDKKIDAGAGSVRNTFPPLFGHFHEKFYHDDLCSVLIAATDICTKRPNNTSLYFNIIRAVGYSRPRNCSFLITELTYKPSDFLTFDTNTLLFLADRCIGSLHFPKSSNLSVEEHSLLQHNDVWQSFSLSSDKQYLVAIDSKMKLHIFKVAQLSFLPALPTIHETYISLV